MVDPYGNFVNLEALVGQISFGNQNTKVICIMNSCRERREGLCSKPLFGEAHMIFRVGKGQFATQPEGIELSPFVVELCDTLKTGKTLNETFFEMK